MIVSLLDIHVTPPVGRKDGSARLEILEAGTGHGSLTLHLARAIHAANTAPPLMPPPMRKRVNLGLEPPTEGNIIYENPDGTPSTEEWATWLSERRAVIHTVDVAASFSNHAEKIVHGFRRGLYAPHVDFYIANVEDWVAAQVSRRRKMLKKTVDPFLTHVILDMPSSQLQIENVAPVIRPDGSLVVFCPSVTQIGDCVRLIKEKKLPFFLDRVVELGTGISSGRLWDVRLATRRSSTANSRSSQHSLHSTDAEMKNEEGLGDESAQVPELRSKSVDDNSSEADQAVMVCRPKVGEYIVGGGFVGLWRRMRERRDLYP